MYKRILLKLSGEQLQGEQNGGFDTDRAKWIAHEVKTAVQAGTQVVIMVGGGNYARGAQLANDAIQRITGDYVGMLATMMNALTLEDVFNHQGLDTRALTNVKSDQVLDQFTHRRAMSHLAKNRVVIVAGGIGRPFLTTDTAAVSLALELDCDAVIKTTKVDGVYSADPAKDPGATKYDTLSYDEVLQNPAIAVMDKAAIGLAMEQNKPVIVCDLLAAGNVARAAAGEAVGTIIS
ncbi:UMP kinase [Candidatus Saccharibacteria bacterium]|jgi:uridylate kinase|nr:UMP kinase [Candidatus Saccharibacteria bacterium]HPR08991.1 UMP kinase [Candidatus Saccharibacteria bacterium]